MPTRAMTSRERPRLLWVAHQHPLPATDGGRIRSLGLLAYLAGRVDLTIVVLNDWTGTHPDTVDRHLPGVEWIDLSGGRAGQVTAVPRLILRGRPPILRHFAQPTQRRALRRLLTTRRFAAVVADTIYTVDALPRRHPDAHGWTALIVNTHNVESEVWRTAGTEVAGGPLRLALDRRLVPRWEREALDMADGAAFCASRDLELLAPSLRSGLELAVVPNAVDTAHLLPLPMPETAHDVLFVGNLAYGPNAEAARFLDERLAPLLEAARLNIVVAGGEGEDRGGIRFAGRPSDLTATYRAAFAVVAPIFSGSGTRLKVLEALALGRPVVATAKAVEGLGLTPDVEYLAAEDETAFAAHLGRLAADPVLRERLVAAGRRLVEIRFSRAAAGEAFTRLLLRCGVAV